MIAGRQILTNLHYYNRVADLEGSQVNGPIIGFTRHGNSNQILNFQPQDDTQAQITLRIGDREVYVASANPSSGDSLRAVENYTGASLYTVHQRPNSVVK
ncbi:hypothetical protein H1R20_g14877, partial [Candolleomyces eurysporus]